MNEASKPADGAGPAASAVEAEVNPYVGLRPFDEEHSEFFFGRREQTLALLERLHSTRFVAVVGSSGSGKSSLVRAGLIPSVKGGFLVEGRDQWRVSTMKPGSAPMRNLAAALLPEGAAPEKVEEFQARLLEESASAVPAELGLGLGLGSKGHHNLLLVVDQFEELFAFLRGDRAGVEGAGLNGEQTLRTRRSAEAADFVSLLLELASAKGLPVYVVLTMRSDFLGDCDLFHELPEAINRSSFLVPRLTRAQLRQAIAGPARGVGVAFSPRLLDEMLNEVGDRADRLPVTQHALLRTWLVRAQTSAIGEDDYEKTGKLDLALERHAEEAYEQCDKALAAQVFKGLTDTDGRGRRVRRASTLGELASLGEGSIAGVKEVLRRFQEGGRYFVTVEETGPEASRRVDLSHESLIRQWPRLREWVDEERRDREQYQDLVRRARQHAQGGNLLAGTDLEMARKWWRALEPSEAWARRDGAGDGGRGLVKDYLTKSEDAARRAHWVRRLLVLAAVVTLVSFTVFSWRQADKARAAEDAATAAAARARSATLVAVAQTSTDPTRQAVVLRVAVKGEASSSLWTQAAMDVLARPIAESVLRGHEDYVSSVAFSPDGKKVVTGSGDNTARVWNADGSGTPLVLLGHEDYVSSVAFSPDGRKVVTGSGDNTARVWNADGTGTPLVLRGHERSVTSVAFSPDGKKVVTGSSDTTARVWNADGSGAPLVLRGHESFVYSVVFSPDGKKVVTGSSDATARVWNADGSGAPLVLRGHESFVYSVVFSPDVKKVVTGSSDTTARVWNADGSGTHLVLRGHESVVSSVAFSPDGRKLVTGSWDQTARVWNADGSGTLVERRLERTVTPVAFRPDGTKVVTGSRDQTARVWNADASGTPLVLRGHEGSVSSVAFSPDGKKVVTGSRDKTARVWNADVSGTPPVLRGHENAVSSVAISPDGKKVVTGSEDKTARMWLIDGELLLAALWDATSDCLELEQRQAILLESPDEARAGHQRCREEVARRRGWPPPTP